MNEEKIKVLLTFQENGQNGGPYHSHQRIMQSGLNQKYEFIPLVVPRFKKLIKPNEAIRFIKNIKTSKARVLHFSGLQLEGFHVLILAKLAGKTRNVCAIRGSVKDVLKMKESHRKIMSAMEKWTLKHSDVCYGVSEYVANWDLIKNNANNCAGAIYNFFEYTHDSATDCKDNRKRIRHELGLGEDDIVIISTGRIIKDKGYEALLRLILRDNWNDCKFVIVGNGNYKDEMHSELVKNGKDKSVIFTGFRNDIPALLDASDIFVTCTLHETLGNSVIEASYHKLPVVATNTGGIPEIVIHEKTGYLFNINDDDALYSYIKLLIQDPDKREQLGNKGKIQIETQFNKEKIEDQLDSLYKSILK